MALHEITLAFADTCRLLGTASFAGFVQLQVVPEFDQRTLLFLISICAFCVPCVFPWLHKKLTRTELDKTPGLATDTLLEPSNYKKACCATCSIDDRRPPMHYLRRPRKLSTIKLSSKSPADTVLTLLPIKIDERSHVFELFVHSLLLGASRSDVLSRAMCEIATPQTVNFKIVGPQIVDSQLMQRCPCGNPNGVVKEFKQYPKDGDPDSHLC